MGFASIVKTVLIVVFVVYLIGLLILALVRTKKFMAGENGPGLNDTLETRRYSDYHVHTTFCDGANTVEEMVLQAIDNGMEELGFSEHSHLESQADWTLSFSDEEKYRMTVETLKKQYKEFIKIRLGIEQDYWSSTDHLAYYDYVIGSVHSLNKDDIEWSSVDMDYANFDYAVNNYFDGDKMAAVERYFELVGDLYNKTKCDVIGHFDLITKLNERHEKETGEPYVDIDDPRYIAAEKKALEKLVATPVIFEINTGAMARGYATIPYPNARVLSYLSSHKTPVIFASDAHAKKDLCYAFDDMMNLVVKYDLNLVTKLP